MIQQVGGLYHDGYYLMPGASYDWSQISDADLPAGPSGVTYDRRVRGRRSIAATAATLLFMLLL